MLYAYLLLFVEYIIDKVGFEFGAVTEEGRQ